MLFIFVDYCDYQFETDITFWLENNNSKYIYLNSLNY